MNMYTLPGLIMYNYHTVSIFLFVSRFKFSSNFVSMINSTSTFIFILHYIILCYITLYYIYIYTLSIFISMFTYTYIYILIFITLLTSSYIISHYTHIFIYVYICIDIYNNIDIILYDMIFVLMFEFNSKFISIFHYTILYYRLKVRTG